VKYSSDDRACPSGATRRYLIAIKLFIRTLLFVSSWNVKKVQSPTARGYE